MWLPTTIVTTSQSRMRNTRLRSYTRTFRHHASRNDCRDRPRRRFGRRRYSRHILGKVLGLLVVIGGWLWIRRRRRRSETVKTKSRPEEAVHELHEKAGTQGAVIGHEIHGGERYEMGQYEHALELQAGKLIQELDTEERTHEVEGTPVR